MCKTSKRKHDAERTAREQTQVPYIAGAFVGWWGGGGGRGGDGVGILEEG